MKEQNIRLMHLAQEHQTVMKFARAMREVATEDEANMPAIALRIRSIFESDLEPHFIEEERHALPMLREAGHIALADEVFAQHEKMRDMEKNFSCLTSASLLEFVRTLEKHIELEEGEVWTILDELLANKAAN